VIVRGPRRLVIQALVASRLKLTSPTATMAA